MNPTKGGQTVQFFKHARVGHDPKHRNKYLLFLRHKIGQMGTISGINGFSWSKILGTLTSTL